MAFLLKSDLRALVETADKPCVSIFTPLVETGSENRQNRIRFKKLVREAEDKLMDTGMRRPDAQSLLAPALRHLDDDTFWQRPGKCYAWFGSPGQARDFRLPLSHEDLTVVGERFHVKPLMPLLTGDGRFFVLALSKNEPRFFEATRDEISEIHLQDMPHGLADILKLYEVPERTLQRHYAPGPGTVAAAHAQGPDTSLEKNKILEYFRQVDRAVHLVLKDSRAPLVLAGVEYLIPIYQEANTYPLLAGKSIPGNADSTKKSPAQLHKEAWLIVEPQFLRAQQNAVALYQQAAGTARGSRKLGEIIPAAQEGRVAILFVAVGEQVWGKVNGEPTPVHIHPTPLPGDEDLLNLAAVQTYLTGGTVYALQQSQMPEYGPVAAVFRY